MSATYERLPIPLQNLACTWAGWRRARARFTPHFHRRLREWEESGRSSTERLLAIQQERLALLVGRARRFVPHYSKLELPEPKLAPDPQRGIEAMLAGFPVLEKSAYRSAPESFIASDIAPERLIKGKTSGTTGSALPLWYTPEALAEEYVAVWRLRKSVGVELYDPHFSFGGQLLVPMSQSKPPFWRKNAWTGQTLFSLYHMTRENLPHYIDALHRLPAVYVQGYPSSLHLLGRAMLDAGRALPAGKLRAVFTSSESLLAFHRETIEHAFGAPIFDRYGTSEFAVSMTACREGRLHVDMEFGIAEVAAEEDTDNSIRGPRSSSRASPTMRRPSSATGSATSGPARSAPAPVDARATSFSASTDGSRTTSSPPTAAGSAASTISSRTSSTSRRRRSSRRALRPSRSGSCRGPPSTPAPRPGS
jgi:phenylacetate-CoA ligase